MRAVTAVAESRFREKTERRAQCLCPSPVRDPTPLCLHSLKGSNAKQLPGHFSSGCFSGPCLTEDKAAYPGSGLWELICRMGTASDSHYRAQKALHLLVRTVLRLHCSATPPCFLPDSVKGVSKTKRLMLWCISKSVFRSSISFSSKKGVT